MGVERFFNKTVTQKRKASRTGDAVESWLNINTALKCCIYPITATDAIAFQSAYNRLNISHKMNCLIDPGTVFCTFVPGDVATGTEIITVILDITTGQEIRFTTTGVIPAPLVAGTTYYAIRMGPTTIKVATTLTLALAGTAVNLTTQGTLVHTLVVIKDIKVDDKMVYGDEEYIVRLQPHRWDKSGIAGSFYEVYLSEVK